MKVLFAARAINNMAGGVERMIVAIMNEMVERGHEVALFSWDREQSEAFYPIASEVAWYRLDMGDPALRADLRTRLKRAPKVRHIVQEFSPDVIVAFQGGPYRALLLYTAGLGIPVVAAERTAPTLYEYASSIRTRKIEHLAFRFAKAITVQFERYRQFYPKNLQSLIVETPNPVPEAAVLAEPAEPDPDGRLTLLSVGRLSYQKNFPVLLQAFESLVEEFPNWDLRIVGEGEDRSKLESMIRSSQKLDGRVFMPGATRSIAAAYGASHLFCLPSRWEGFPNALAEALAHGLPGVGFKDCAGVPDLIESGCSGLLAYGNNDPASLREALSTLMGDSAKRVEMGRAATRAMRKYRPEVCFERWEDVLATAAGK